MSHEIAVADKTTPDAEPQLPQQALAQWTATVATHLPHLPPRRPWCSRCGVSEWSWCSPVG